MFCVVYNKDHKKRTRPLRLLLVVGILISAIYGSYVFSQKEKTIETLLQTPEGRQALAEALVEAAKKKRN